VEVLQGKHLPQFFGCILLLCASVVLCRLMQKRRKALSIGQHSMGHNLTGQHQTEPLCQLCYGGKSLFSDTSFNEIRFGIRGDCSISCLWCSPDLDQHPYKFSPFSQMYSLSNRPSELDDKYSKQEDPNKYCDGKHKPEHVWQHSLIPQVLTVVFRPPFDHKTFKYLVKSQRWYTATESKKQI